MNTCSTASRELHEPLGATAAEARTWILLEQAGPWGPVALTESHLDPKLGRTLQARARGTGTRFGLIRRPGRHADNHRSTRRAVIVAHTTPGNSWLRHTTVSDPHELLSWDLAALGRGEQCGTGDEGDGHLALVCTNGRRDRCCALLGRDLARELRLMGETELWETTHIGGHRFAPTMLVLPHGYAYGRLSAPSAKAVLEAAGQGRMTIEWCRGRSTWSRPGQAAELAVRAHTGEELTDAFTVGAVTAADGQEPMRWSVSIRHTDGRTWTVVVDGKPAVQARPESCGGAPGRPVTMTAVAVSASG